MAPPSRLIVLGDGDVAEPLLRVADLIGYESIVRADDLPRDLAAGDHVVVTSMDVGRARDQVRRAAQADCAYIGLCADEREAMKVLLLLSKERLPKERLDRIAAPAGLAIGAATAGERAVAVAADLVRARRGAPPPALPPRTDGGARSN